MRRPPATRSARTIPRALGTASRCGATDDATDRPGAVGPGPRDCYYGGSANPPDRERPLMAVTDLDLGRYKLGWSDDVVPVFKPEKGLNTTVVDDMSWWKGE